MSFNFQADDCSSDPYTSGDYESCIARALKGVYSIMIMECSSPRITSKL